MPNVWLQSRRPGKTARLANHWVHRTGGGYADIYWEGHRYAYSHDVVICNEANSQETWLVFTDAGPGGADQPQLLRTTIALALSSPRIPYPRALSHGRVTTSISKERMWSPRSLSPPPPGPSRWR